MTKRIRVHFSITGWLISMVEELDVPEEYDCKLIRRQLNTILKQGGIPAHQKVKNIFFIEELSQGELLQ